MVTKGHGVDIAVDTKEGDYSDLIFNFRSYSCCCLAYKLSPHLAMQNICNNMYKLSIILIGITFIFGCSEKVSNTDAISHVIGFNQIKNKVFFLGPELDTMKVEITAECDCCASDLILKEDSTFLIGNYCLEEDEYTYGRYHVRDNKLILNFNSKSLMVSNSHTDSIPPIYKFEDGTQKEVILELTKIKNSVAFKIDNEFGLERKKEDAKKVIGSYKKDSIDKKLGIEL